MAKQTIYNAGIYVRLSQEDMRAGESLSIENQKLILTKYVKEQGWNLVDTYVDDGYSGTSFERPGVQKLLDDAKTGIINLIIVKDLSRFGRNYIEVGRYIDYIFPMHNIRFIALNDNVDTASKDSTAMDMMPIINLFNEWHASSTSKKIKAVLKANAKAGKYRSTCAPFGYDKGPEPNHLPVIDPYAAPIVKRIFEMRSKGITPHQISIALNDENIPIPSDYYYQKIGKPNPRRTRHLWSPAAIRQLVKNPTYLIIESNHDIKMLLHTNRTFELKNRIMSDKGHLCNEDSAIAAISIIGDKTKEIVLAHLSEEANTPEVALEAYQKIFKHFGVNIQNYKVRTAWQRQSLTGGNYPHEN